MSAQSMLSLKGKACFFRFRHSFNEIGTLAKSITQIKEAFAISVETNKRNLVSLDKIILDEAHKKIPSQGLELSSEQIEIAGEQLEHLTLSALGNLREMQNSSNNFQNQLPEFFPNTATIKGQASQTVSKLNNKMSSKFTLTVFTALREERDVLVKRWGLKHQYGDVFWKGERNQVQLLVYSSLAIGRVPAAIATTKALQDNRPDMLVIAGIAGGFEETNVRLGNILVGDKVVDLASRKMQEDKPEFRPITFDTDKRILEFLDSGSFDCSAWERNVIEDAEWPNGLRPTLHIGPVASLDDVVSSEDWKRELLKAWPKLLGVEMEAGGVCAAAKQKGIDVAVIRGVSDLADPRKSDSDWRGRAMKTVAILIEDIIDSGQLFIPQ